MLTLSEEKDYINNLIANGLKEILHIGLAIDGNNLGRLEDEVSLFMKELQQRRQVYDFAVMIDYNSLLNRFEGKVAYSLIKSDDPAVEDMVEFVF